MKPILSLRDLSSRLGLSVEHLREVAASAEGRYETWPLFDKRNPSIVRHITAPNRELKDVQRLINNNILTKLPMFDGVHGGVRGRSPRTNAEPHTGQPCVVNLDVKKFFPNVRHYVVYRLFRRDLGFGRDVSRLLTRLTTRGSELPQGAPTSTTVANLLLATHVDRALDRRAGRLGCRYTRFVDDITLSGANPRPLINGVARMLSSRRLQMYRKQAKPGSKAKLRIAQRSNRQEVTGLVVNSQNGPSVSRRRRDKIRAEIFALRNAETANIRCTGAISIRGKIAHVRAFNPGSADRLQRYLDTTLAELV